VASSNETDRQPSLGELVMGKPRATSGRFASRFKAWLLSEEHPHQMKERMAQLDEHPRREEEAEARWHSA
jgi:hypothetical protein